MAEPTSATATSLSVATAGGLLGPLAGPWAIVIICALAGAQWAVSREKLDSTWAGAALMFRCVITSCVLSGFVSWMMSKAYPAFSSVELLGPVAFVVAALGNRVNSVIDRVSNAVLPGKDKPANGN